MRTSDLPGGCPTAPRSRSSWTVWSGPINAAEMLAWWSDHRRGTVADRRVIGDDGNELSGSREHQPAGGLSR